jgi:hypothetical protein
MSKTHILAFCVSEVKVYNIDNRKDFQTRRTEQNFEKQNKNNKPSLLLFKVEVFSHHDP